MRKSFSGVLGVPADARFEAKVRRSGDGCWQWTGAIDTTGYGRFGASPGVVVGAHRWSYEHHVGPIPDGYQIDHLCRNRACVNPAHLEAVTQQENIKRQAAVRTTCPSGHPWDEANTRWYRGYRRCRACDRQRNRKRHIPPTITGPVMETQPSTTQPKG